MFNPAVMSKIMIRTARQPLSIEGRREPWMARSASTGMYVPDIDNGWRAVLIIILHTLLLLSPPSFAARLIIEPEMGRAPIISEIESAKQSVKLVMYNLTDKELLNALLQQQADGREVQIILEKTP